MSHCFFKKCFCDKNNFVCDDMGKSHKISVRSTRLGKASSIIIVPFLSAGKVSSLLFSSFSLCGVVRSRFLVGCCVYPTTTPVTQREVCWLLAYIFHRQSKNWHCEGKNICKRIFQSCILFLSACEEISAPGGGFVTHAAFSTSTANEYYADIIWVSIMNRRGPF